MERKKDEIDQKEKEYLTETMRAVVPLECPKVKSGNKQCQTTIKPLSRTLKNTFKMSECFFWLVS